MILSGDNVTIKGSTVAATVAANITAVNGVNITAEKDLSQTDASVGKRGGYYFNR
ncbi:hypothetical protein [Propionispora sp. 2/2-37]|uniref:hypothetical protein n=1 Tax=Propionispora sp. 2/2-37 TaxID=1677858 RepID=UPI0012E0CD5E|nr:hypothetical protein [Propionispora sp. 2/2-37]